jgi:hypothetical protein
MSAQDTVEASTHLMSLPPLVGRVSLASRSIGSMPYMTLPHVKQVVSGVPGMLNMRPWQRGQRGNGFASFAIATSGGWMCVRFRIYAHTTVYMGLHVEVPSNTGPNQR